MTNNAHFDLGQWTDYARDMVTSEQRAVMHRHLSGGCAECQSLVSWLQKIVLAAHNEVEVPGPVVDAAKAIAAAQAPERPFRALRRIAARLIHDSFAAPQPVGARSVRQTSRHVLYRAGDYNLDLRIEREVESRQLILTGQIADRKTPDVALSHVPILLHCGKGTVAETASNEFGEFCLEYTPRRDIQLCIPLFKVGKQVEVSLNLLMGYR